MQIETVTTYNVENPPPYRGGYHWVFVKLETDDGITGLGEAYGVPFDPDVTARLIRDVGERHVIGKSPLNVERIWREIYTGSADTHTPHHPDLTTSAIISAFDMACLDIVGKALGEPVYNLLGGQYHEKLRSYTYLYPEDDSNEDTLAVFTDPDWAARSGARPVEVVVRSGAEVRHAALHRVPLPAVRAAQHTRPNPPVRHLVRQQDQPVRRPAPGAGQEIAQLDVHGVPC